MGRAGLNPHYTPCRGGHHWQPAAALPSPFSLSGKAPPSPASAAAQFYEFWPELPRHHCVPLPALKGGCRGLGGHTWTDRWMAAASSAVLLPLACLSYACKLYQVPTRRPGCTPQPPLHPQRQAWQAGTSSPCRLDCCSLLARPRP